MLLNSKNISYVEWKNLFVCNMNVSAEIFGMWQAHFAVDAGKPGQICVIRMNLEKMLPYIKSKLSL